MKREREGLKGKKREGEELKDRERGEHRGGGVKGEGKGEGGVGVEIHLSCF